MVDVAAVVVVPRGNEEADLIVAGCFEGEEPSVEGAGEEVRATARRLAGRPGWAGRADQTVQTEVQPGGPVLCLWGLGKGGDFTFSRLSRWFYRATESAR